MKFCKRSQGDQFDFYKLEFVDCNWSESTRSSDDCIKLLHVSRDLEVKSCWKYPPVPNILPPPLLEKHLKPKVGMEYSFLNGCRVMFFFLKKTYNNRKLKTLPILVVKGKIFPLSYGSSLIFYSYKRGKKKMVIYLPRQSERGHNFSWAFWWWERPLEVSSVLGSPVEVWWP